MSDREWYNKFQDLIHALRRPEDLPPPHILELLPGNFGKDWERGKAMQWKHGLDKIPAKCECEIGAGYWDRVIKPMGEILEKEL